MNISSAIFLIAVLAITAAADCPKKTNSKLVCYYSKLTHVDSCKCSHVVLPADSDVKSIDRMREHLKGVKILITVNEFNQGLVDILKSSKVDGIEINLKKLDSKNDINDFISTVRSRLGSDLYIVLAVPSKAETLAKYYDFKALSKNADLFVLQTAFLGASKNVTFHPSRLSGLWDMQNTDSVVDLVSGLGAPLSKLVITSPVQAFKFKLQSEKHTAPGSPALEVQSVTRNELCQLMGNGGNWTLERDQDQAGPYIFSKDQWIAFDDATSVDIKAKYARVRGLAGIALKDLSQDGGEKCESSILDAAFNGLSRQARAPRGAVLHSLEREILETPARPLDTIQVSPYRISRVIDVEGNVHVIRQDTRTEFECSRQGYFVHPRSCGRFYRCVKFDQLSDEFSVFEFDCPAGLAFDSTVEVCVWPGSLSHGSPCSGSSEIAPVPRERFVCPHEPGYYADPENCRWFFACLDHGKSPLSAYEFRCPFGLVYDESRLLCEWPWLVPKCASGYAVASHTVYGGAGSIALDQYDGLGVLGVTSLGGLHGPLQQPEAKIYSNVGLVSQGQNYVAGTGQLSLKATQSLQNAGLLGTGIVSGLGYATANDGNVRFTNEQIYGSGHLDSQGQEAVLNAAHHGGGFGVRLQQTHGSGLGYTQGQDSVLNTAYHGDGYGVNSQKSSIHGVNVNSELGYTLNRDASLLNTGLYQGTVASDLQTNYVDHGTNLNYQTGTSGAAIVGTQSGQAYDTNLHVVNGGATLIGTAVGGAKSTQSYGGTAGVHLIHGIDNKLAHGYIGTSNAHLVNGLAENSQQGVLQYHQPAGAVFVNDNLAQGAEVSGYDSAKSTVEYHGNSGSSGTNGNINIVGGGYSAVGVANSGIDVTNYGEDTNTVAHVTASPISVSTVSSIPIVTSVPVPALKVATGFQSFKGGVVANVPELQYKVHNNLASSRGSSGFANFSQGFVNLVSSTPSTIVTNDGYHYPKPTVSFIEEPARSTLTTGTAYVQQNLASVQPVVTGYQQPIVVSTTQTPLAVERVNVQPVTTYQKPVSTSFVQHHVTNVQPVVTTYQKPVVTTYQKPVVVSTTQVPFVEEKINIQPVVTTYQQHVSNVQPVVTTYQKPVFVSTTPTPIVQEKINIQPVVTTHQHFQPVVTTHQQHFQPVVTTYQKPVVVSTTQAPVVFEKVNIQPAVSTYNLQKQDSFVGYDYPKPAVRFEETPVKTTGGSFSYQNLDLINSNPAITVNEVPLKTVNQAAVTRFSYSAPSTVKPVTLVEQVQPVVQVQPTVQTVVQPVIKQQPAISFASFQKHETIQPQLQVTSHNVPSSTLKPIVVEQTPQVYVSSTPAPVVQQRVQPAIVSSFSISSNSEGYNYQKPSIDFDEKPSVITYQQPAVQKTVIASQPVSTFSYQAPVQVTPAVSTYGYKNVLQTATRGGYSYPKPAIAFEETPASVTRLNYVQKPAVVSSYSYTAPSTVKPTVVVQKQTPVVTSYTYTAPSTVRPAVYVQQPVTTYIASTPKSAIFIPQQPAVVSSYSYTGSSTAKPAVVAEPVLTYTPKPVVLKKKPAVISSFSFTAQPKKVEFSGYDYPKPVVQFSEGPAQIVTSYENRQPVQEVPFVAKKAYVTGGQSNSYQYTQQYNNVATIEQKQPLVVENYQAPVQPVVVSTTPLYEYKQQYNVEVNPVVLQKQVVSTTPRYEYKQQFQVNPVVLQKQVVSTTPRYEYKQQYSVDSGYIYDRPAVPFEEKPLVVENYQAPISQTPGTSYYISETPRVRQKVVSSTPRPIVDYTYIQSTPKPTFASTVAAVVTNKQPFRYYDSRLVSTARPVTYSTSVPIVETVSTSRPVAKFSFNSFDDQYQQIHDVGKTVNYVAPIEVTTPTRDYLPARGEVTTSRPIAKYSFSSFDTQYQQNTNLGGVVEDYVAPSRDYSPVQVTTSAPTEAFIVPEAVPVSDYGLRVTTSAPTVVSEIVTPTREYLPARGRVRVTTASTPVVVVPEVSTAAPPRVRVTTSAPEVITPSREYLPVRSRVRVTTTPASTYLPADDDYDLARTQRPVDIVRVSRPKTIVKVNDFHPLLSAKLGAQCTCVSNSVRYRKKPLRIVVDDDDDDGYVVDNSDEGIVVENYQYEPQRTVDITPTPEVYIKSTTAKIVEPSPSPIYSARRRVRVRPATSTVLYESPVTEAANIIVNDVVTPVGNLVDGDSEVINAVISDTKLEQASRERAKAALPSRNLDRYGPGGLRSRNEKLQGTIDCQRAGLFRHPTQCNKFYACRWDCTKNRYTLHIFNCPVHLTFDNNLGACNWPSQGPACLENTLLPND